MTDLDSLVQARQFGGEALDIRSLSGGQHDRNRSNPVPQPRNFVMDEATDGWMRKVKMCSVKLEPIILKP